MIHLTNGIGWGGTGREGGTPPIKKIKDKLKTGSYKLSLWGLSIILSVAPYHAFTESLLNNRQYQCVKKLWHKESKWNPEAVSATSDYGIPQRHMRKASNEAKTKFLSNPYSQILWGLGYIEHRYGSACIAWEHSQRKGWY